MTKQTSPAQVRPSRVPLSGRNRLAVKNKDEGYVYRYVNANLENDPDRIERMKEAGYELVSRDVAGKLGDNRVDNSTPIGSTASISVGQGTRAVLMRIRKDWYDEDQSVKQREIAALEQTMKSESKADYGKLNPNARVDE
jgi:hypothetical protein